MYVLFLFILGFTLCGLAAFAGITSGSIAVAIFGCIVAVCGVGILISLAVDF